jgi:hypothetical protein
MEKLLKIIISHFFIRGKPVVRYRDVRTGRFVKSNMFRTAFGIKQLPLNHKYYGVVFYVWTKEPLTAQQVDEAYRLFEAMLESYLGYGGGEWWFSIFQQTNFEMKLRVKLINVWRFKIDYKGVSIYERQGNY